MANLGIAPPDVDTELGQFRVSVGDTDYTEVEPGIGNYTYFSDVELESILGSTGSGNAGMAAAYRKLAAILALKAVNITTDDLRVATEQRAEIMRKIANDFASAADAQHLANDIFQLAGGQPGGRRCAELAEHPWRCGCGPTIV